MITVGIGVEPPLLADLLRRLLWAPDRQFEVRRATSETGVFCDVAVTSTSLHDAVTASVQLQLPDDEGGGGWGTLIIDHRCAPVPIDSVADILALVDRASAR